MTHDYKRNGTTTLFTAMNTLDGSVISRCQQRHRHIEWLTFLRQIDLRTAKAHDILAKVIRANSRSSSKQNEALH